MEWNVTFCCDVVWYGTVCKCPKLSHTVFWRGAMVAMTPFFLIFWTSAINSQVQRIASVLEWYTPRRLMLKTFQSKELLCGILHGSKAWYGNAVEQLPNIERTHSKAIRLKMFLKKEHVALQTSHFNVWCRNIWPHQPRVSKVSRSKALIAFRNLCNSLCMSFGKRSVWGRMVHAVLTKPAKLIRSNTMRIWVGVRTVGAGDLGERTEISDMSSWSTTAASSSVPWRAHSNMDRCTPCVSVCTHICMCLWV